MGFLSFMGNSKTISPEMALQIMEEHPDHVLLDVRNPDEFAWAYIEGATLLPINLLTSEASTKLPDKEAYILVYCHIGYRSAQAVKMLGKMGYNNVYDIGGIIEWPYDIVSG